MSSEIESPNNLRFANETAKLVYETVQIARRIARELPQEEKDENMELINLGEGNKQGLTTIFSVGPGAPSKVKGEFWIPNRTLRVLGEMGIDFSRVES